MKIITALLLPLFGMAAPVFADTHLKCDTGMATRQSPQDDVGSHSALNVTSASGSGTLSYTQDQTAPNKPYNFTIPEGAMVAIDFQSPDGSMKFHYTASSYQSAWGSEMDATDSGTGVTITTGSSTDASAKLSVRSGLKSAFVYCIQSR